MKDQGEVYSVVNVIGYQLQSPACSCGPGVHTRTAENSARSHADLHERNPSSAGHGHMEQLHWPMVEDGELAGDGEQSTRQRVKNCSITCNSAWSRLQPHRRGRLKRDRAASPLIIVHFCSTNRKLRQRNSNGLGGAIESNFASTRDLGLLYDPSTCIYLPGKV